MGLLPWDFKSHASAYFATPAGTAKGSGIPLPFFHQFRAGNGTRTRDPNLGKVVLYQLSYSRNSCFLIAIYASPLAVD